MMMMRMDVMLIPPVVVDVGVDGVVSDSVDCH